jgi:hypothetical protein
MNAVLRELRHTIPVEDPCCYSLPKCITNSIVKRQPRLVAVFKGSYVDRNDLLDCYWNKVEYAYLPTKQGTTPIVWYEFNGKHMRIVN